MMSTKPVFGLTREGARRTAETNHRVLDQLPEHGRRTRRLYPPGGGRSSGGNELIDFEVVDYCPLVPQGNGQAVYAVVTRISCASSVDVGDEVVIYDPDLCWLNLPVDLLVGLRGTAALMANDGTFPRICAVEPDLSECIWIVKSLCCREEQYSEV